MLGTCKLDFCLYCNRGIKMTLTSDTDIYVQTAFYYNWHHFTLLYHGGRAFEIIITNNILTSGILVLTQLCCSLRTLLSHLTSVSHTPLLYLWIRGLINEFFHNMHLYCFEPLILSHESIQAIPQNLWLKTRGVCKFTWCQIFSIYIVKILSCYWSFTMIRQLSSKCTCLSTGSCFVNFIFWKEGTLI